MDVSKIMLHQDIYQFILKYIHKFTTEGKTNLAYNFISLHKYILNFPNLESIYNIFLEQAKLLNVSTIAEEIFDLFFEVTNNIKFLECQCKDKLNLKQFIHQKLFYRQMLNNDINLIDNQMKNIDMSPTPLQMINTMIL